LGAEQTCEGANSDVTNAPGKSMPLQAQQPNFGERAGGKIKPGT
jgi:hypothetical protein